MDNVGGGKGQFSHISSLVHSPISIGLSGLLLSISLLGFMLSVACWVYGQCGRGERSVFWSFVILLNESSPPYTISIGLSGFLSIGLLGLSRCV